MKVVLDTGVVIAGAGWRREAYRCLYLAALRLCIPYATTVTLAELRRVANRMYSEGDFGAHNPWPVLNWYLDMVRLVEPAPLGKQRSRDAGDDPFLTCALAAGAGFVISRDPHLLNLGKPFGVHILTPRAFLSHVAKLI